MLLNKVFQTVKRESPILYTIAMIHLVGAVLCIPLILLDDRELMGVNVWIKPIKFLFSVGIYLLTVGYLITFYPFSKTKKNIVRNIASWSMLFEVGIIVFQAARGVQSHYNEATPMDGILFALMGLFVGINVLLMVFFIIETIRLKLSVTRQMQLAIFLGWIIIFFGSWIGGQMIMEKAHNIGVADGGPGLPLVNWSTVAGDLRVAHFFGLHGLQLVPLFAFVIDRYISWKARTQTIVVILFGILYLLWIAAVFYQATLGEPFIAV